tara:strand:+ start:89 stop:1165 length:1077 start_codon:yes stop_codon:yes gene_type:complete
MSIITEAVDQLINNLSDSEKKILRRRQAQKEYYQRNSERKKAQVKARYVAKQKPVFEIPVITKKTIYSELELMGLITNDETYSSESTRKTHISAVKRIFKIVSSIKELNKIFKFFIETLQTGSGYSINTIKSTISSLLSILNKYNIQLINNKNMTTLLNLYNTYILMANDEQVVKNENVTVPTWFNYLNKTERIFGKNSKQYLVASLYSVLTVRDDFASLIFVRMTDATDDDKNYLAVDENDDYYIILNQYKTSNRYATVKFKLPLKIKRLMKNWLANQVKYFNEQVFKESSLSPFVTDLHRQIGYGDLGQGAVNLYRKMSVSALEGSSYEQKAEMASQMKHSVLTQQKYKRLLKIEE